MCISNYHRPFNLIISRTNHVSFTLKRIPYRSDIDSSVTIKTLLSFTLHMCLIEY